MTALLETLRKFQKFSTQTALESLSSITYLRRTSPRPPSGWATHCYDTRRGRRIAGRTLSGAARCRRRFIVTPFSRAALPRSGPRRPPGRRSSRSRPSATFANAPRRARARAGFLPRSTSLGLCLLFPSLRRFSTTLGRPHPIPFARVADSSSRSLSASTPSRRVRSRAPPRPRPTRRRPRRLYRRRRSAPSPSAISRRRRRRCGASPTSSPRTRAGARRSASASSTPAPPPPPFAPPPPRATPRWRAPLWRRDLFRPPSPAPLAREGSGEWTAALRITTPRR